MLNFGQWHLAARFLVQGLEQNLDWVSEYLFGNTLRKPGPGGQSQSGAVGVMAAAVEAQQRRPHSLFWLETFLVGRCNCPDAFQNNEWRTYHRVRY